MSIVQMWVMSDKNLLEFKNLRNNLVRSYNNCTTKVNDQTDEMYLKKFKKFPACLKQLTRQICKCERNCFNSFFENLGLSLECQDKNTVVNLFSNEYIDCSIFNVRIVDGIIVNPDNISYNYIKNRMRKILENLCHENYYEFNQLECIVYEIKDICSFDIECIESFVPESVPLNCLNEYSKVQLKVIEDMIGVPIFDINLDVEKDVSRAERSVDDQMYEKYVSESLDNQIYSEDLINTFENQVNEKDFNKLFENQIYEKVEGKRNILSNNNIYSSILTSCMIFISIICGAGFWYKRVYSRKPRSTDDLI